MMYLLSLHYKEKHEQSVGTCSRTTTPVAVVQVAFVRIPGKTRVGVFSIFTRFLENLRESETLV